MVFECEFVHVRLTQLLEHILLFASTERGGLGEESNPISSRGPAEQAGKVTDIESTEVLLISEGNPNSTRGPAEQAGKVTGMEEKGEPK